MNIDATKLTEVYLRHGVPKVSNDERFYQVPGAADYALSDYGRLYNLVTNRKARFAYIDDPWHSGEGYYISNGKYIPIKYTKDSVDSPIKLFNVDDTPLEINVGKTYIAIFNQANKDQINMNYNA